MIYKPLSLVVHEESQWEASLEGLLKHTVHFIDSHGSI